MTGSSSGPAADGVPGAETLAPVPDGAHAGGGHGTYRVVIVRRAEFVITAASRSDAKKQMRRLRVEQPPGTRWVTIANTVVPQWVTQRPDRGRG